jgi:hypothetical protein
MQPDWRLEKQLGPGFVLPSAALAMLPAPSSAAAVWRSMFFFSPWSERAAASLRSCLGIAADQSF